MSLSIYSTLLKEDFDSYNICKIFPKEKNILNKNLYQYENQHNESGGPKILQLCPDVSLQIFNLAIADDDEEKTANNANLLGRVCVLWHRYSHEKDAVQAFAQRDLANMAFLKIWHVMLSEFAHKIPHELRSPITTIQSFDRILVNPQTTLTKIKNWLNTSPNPHPSNFNLLVVNNMHLQTIPSSLSKFNQLRLLNLSDNSLIALPMKPILELPHLTELSVANNFLSSIPDEIGKCTSLMRLNLSQNQIVKIPSSISKLKQLTWLYLNHNQIASIPDKIQNLTKLVRLDLSYNQISDTPHFFQKTPYYLSLEGNPCVSSNKRPAETDLQEENIKRQKTG